MPAIYQGDKKIVDRYVGEILVTRTYQGDKLIFDAYSELSGNLPLAVRSRASQVLENYIIYGESVQDGTPTPDNPVEVTGLGVRTVNLFDKDTYLVGGTLAPVATRDCYNVIIRLKANTTYVMSSDVPSAAGYNHLYVYSANYANPYQIIYRNHPAEVTTGEDGCIYFQYATRTYYNQLLDGTYYVMLTEGSTPPASYIPYGYKLPLKATAGGATTDYPVYIGSEPLMRISNTEYADYVDYEKGKIVRRVKKLVLTGDEEWSNSFGQSLFGVQRLLNDAPFIAGISAYSTHFKYNPVQSNLDSTMINGEFALQKSANVFNVFLKNTDFTSAADFKAWLANLYAAGTPVIVWYALATPVEEDPPVPFPDIALSQGTVTIDIEGNLKPQATVKGRINPTA